jgi:Tfp pilus assembly protein PilF
VSTPLAAVLAGLALLTAAGYIFMRSRQYKALILRRAAVLASSGRIGDMTGLLQRNRDRSSVSDPLTNALVYFLLRSGRHDEAEKVVVEAIEKGDKSGAAVAQLGFAAAGRGDRKSAEELYRKALDKEPSLGRTVNVNLAALMMEDGRLDEAESVLVEALEMREGASRSGVHSSLSILYLKKGQPRDALVHAMNSYELQPASELTRLGRAQSLAVAARASALLGDIPQSRGLAEKALHIVEKAPGAEALTKELAHLAGRPPAEAGPGA